MRPSRRPLVLLCVSCEAFHIYEFSLEKLLQEQFLSLILTIYIILPYQSFAKNLELSLNKECALEIMKEFYTRNTTSVAFQLRLSSQLNKIYCRLCNHQVTYECWHIGKFVFVIFLPSWYELCTGLI